jgi:hypothetical protein
MRNLLLATVLLATTLLAAACTVAGGGPAPSPVVAGPLVAVTSRGGDCQGVPCDRTVTLMADGTLRLAAKEPNEVGRVPLTQVDRIRGLIAAADFPAMLARPYTSECPTAYDGVETVVTFWSGDVQHVLAGCTVAIDWGDPLLSAVSAVFGPYTPVPIR